MTASETGAIPPHPPGKKKSLFQITDIRPWVGTLWHGWPSEYKHKRHIFHWNYTLSHNYVSQSFSVINQKIVYLRRFPFQAVITESSGVAKIITITLSVCKISIIFHFRDSLKITYDTKNVCVNKDKIKEHNEHNGTLLYHYDACFYVALLTSIIPLSRLLIMQDIVKLSQGFNIGVNTAKFKDRYLTN